MGLVGMALPALTRYRKRPIVVHAARMQADFEVETLEGLMRGKAGDYLVRGIEGELYPCAARIFDATYEPLP